MTLYYVRSDDADGYKDANALFVRAKSPQEAITFWQRYYNVADELPDSVDEIPATPKRGAIGWDMLLQVWVNQNPTERGTAGWVIQ